MECGQLFTSFDEFKNILKEYEKDKRQKFVIKGSRSIKIAEKILNRKLKEDLKYYEIQYICVHGGAVRRRGKGIRKTRTYKMNCPALIKLRATKTGDFLQIKQLVEKHENHEMSEVSVICIFFCILLYRTIASCKKNSDFTFSRRFESP
uniref:Uncharacterized protein LOC114332612 n=1 Tax=Diabrotica virgifera virgifera TaxID=50390 RepID=A0A6P7FZG6_DIAVI